MASVRKVAISAQFSVKVTKWHVKQGHEVVKDANLASYVYCNREAGSKASTSERKLKSRFDGRVSKIVAKVGEEIPPGSPVIIIKEEHCMHTIVMKEMCCECGADLRKEAGIPGDLSEPVAAEISMVHNIPELRVSVEEAERIARYDERQLLKTKRLALVVDLDQTLIHTTHEAVPMDIQEIFHFRLPDHPFEYHTKLRPGAKKFLEAASKYYELHIFTMGSRMYAHTIARHLDPDEKLFAHRIRSRDECLDGYSKSQDLRALFPCGDHMVCIIDDRQDVWNFAPNLITVKPYRYFTGTGDINDPFGNTESPENPDEKQAIDKDEKTSNKQENGDQDLKTKENGTTKEAGDDGEKNDKSEEAEDGNNDDGDEEEKEGGKVNSEKAESEVSEPQDLDNDSNGADHPPDLDDYLFYLEEILERVHSSFYSSMEEIKSKGGLSRNDPTITRFCTPGTTNPDSRAIIPALRQQTLKGANLVFTGVVPTNVPLKNSAVYRTAIGLGANVTENVVSSATTSNKQDYTTHVIAARLGTEKAYRASRMRGVKLVGVEWLWCCAQRWEWVDERLFPVPSREQGNGENTPDSSSRGTPTFAEMSRSKRGKRSGKGSRNEAKELLRSRIPTPDDIIESINPVSFSKDEMDQMDKEVEEYMLTDEEADEDGDMLGSVSGSSSRNSGRSSTDSSKSSSSSSRSPTPPTSLEGYNKRKKELSDKLDAIKKKRRALVPQSVKENHDDDDDDDDDDQSSDSSSSENSMSSEDDFQIGEMLEKQIND